MEQKRKKFFPGDAKSAAPKAAGKTGRSAFQARKIPDFHHGTPASNCVSMRDQFDIYIDEKYNSITTERRQTLWLTVSEDMLSKSSDQLIITIDSYLASEVKPEGKRSKGTK